MRRLPILPVRFAQHRTGIPFRLASVSVLRQDRTTKIAKKRFAMENSVWRPRFPMRTTCMSSLTSSFSNFIRLRNGRILSPTQ